MKTMKKVMALVLAAVMVIALGATVALATEPTEPVQPDYSITVTNAVAGETYNAYKMFDLSIDDPTNPTAYRYTVNSAWTGFTDTDEFKAVFTIDAQGYVTSTVTSTQAWSAESDLSKVADAAAKYAKNHNISIKATATPSENGDAVLNVGEAGYYVIASTLGSRAMIETTPGATAVTIVEKNEQDTIEKHVKEDSNGDFGTANDAQIGDTVEFKSKVEIVARSVNVKIHDTMDSGLTLNPGSITIYTDESLTTPYTGATIKTGTEAESGDTFTIEIPDAFAAAAANTQTLFIVYTAELNANVVNSSSETVALTEQKNKTTISFGEHTSSVESSTTTTTHKFSVFKHKKDDTANLADAVFQVKKGNTIINLIKLDDTNYRVADDTETGTPSSHAAGNDTVNEIANNTLVSDFVTVGSGDIVIWGVDADNDYTIVEIQAPKGYNMLNPASVDVHVTADNNLRLDVENSSGTELPSTGGIGTTIFYIIGAVLVVGAVVVLVTRRRMNARK